MPIFCENCGRDVYITGDNTRGMDAEQAIHRFVVRNYPNGRASEIAFACNQPMVDTADGRLTAFPSLVTRAAFDVFRRMQESGEA